jgi:hypothetical protein
VSSAATTGKLAGVEQEDGVSGCWPHSGVRQDGWYRICGVYSEWQPDWERRTISCARVMSVVLRELRW